MVSELSSLRGPVEIPLPVGRWNIGTPVWRGSTSGVTIMWGQRGVWSPPWRRGKFIIKFWGVMIHVIRRRGWAVRRWE